MSLDRQINPVTLDYVNSTKAGAFAEVDVVENQIAMAFSIPLGSWEGDPEFGHRFNELANATDTVQNRKRLEDLGRDALQFLIDDGSLSKVDCAVEQFALGVVAFQVDAYRADSSQVQLPTFLVSVGGSP